MFAVANVEKFLKGKGRLAPGQAEAILKRAKEVASKGVFSGGSVAHIMGDTQLAGEFVSEVMGDPDHVKIGMQAINEAIPGYTVVKGP